MTMEIRRADWLLILLALRDSSEPLDPVRLQKGMFLLAEEARIPAKQRYNFVAYDYGPFSVDIYRDIEALDARGLIERIPAPGYTWSRYRPSPAGLEEAQRLVTGMTAKQRNQARVLERVKQDVLRMGFRELLAHVYAHHPEFRENSVFNG